MIESIKSLGNNLLEGLNEEDRKKELLKSLCIEPKKYFTKNNKEIELNEIIVDLDTKNGKINVYSEPISKEKETYFGFTSKNPNDRKIYFSTNNANNLFYGAVPEIKEYMENNFEKLLETDFYKFVRDIHNKFYVNKEGKDILDPSKIEELNEYTDDPSQIVSKCLNLSKAILDRHNLFSLKINGNYLQNLFPKDYSEIIYLQRIGSDFSEKDTKENIFCSLCIEKKKVTGKVNLPTKFYTVDKNNFFENQNGGNSYKAFAICENCYQDYLRGHNYIKNNLNGRLGGLDYYMIPKNNFDSDTSIEILKKISNFLGNSKEKNSLDVETRVYKKSKRKNIKFDLLFFYSQQASFNVVKHISDIYFRDIKNIQEEIDKINETINYPKLGYSEISVNSFYWLLFSNEDKSKPDKYRKQLLEILGSFLNKREISEDYLLRRFLLVSKKTYLDKDSKKYQRINLSAQSLKMNKFLLFLIKMGLIETQKDSNFEVLKSINELEGSLPKFFKSHHEIYGKSPEKQGLVLLGYLINQIISKQKDKSRTFMDKLDFNGIKPKRIKNLISDVVEFLKFNDLFTYPFNRKVYSLMIDRLQEIDSSNLKREDILFYILTGVGVSFNEMLENSGKEEKNE